MPVVLVIPLLLIGLVALYVLIGYTLEFLGLNNHWVYVPLVPFLMIFGIWLLLPLLYSLADVQTIDVPFLDILFGILTDDFIIAIFALLFLIFLIVCVHHRRSK